MYPFRSLLAMLDLMCVVLDFAQHFPQLFAEWWHILIHDPVDGGIIDGSIVMHDPVS